MSTSDNKPRQRIKIACEECRKGKRKCDGRKPICSLCQRSGRICVYVSEESRKRKYQDDDLVQRLQEQIQSLENALAQARALGFQDIGDFENEDSSPARCDIGDTLKDGNFVGHEGSSDLRSPVAMEELATLMLKMDVEDRGEPSFTITPGKPAAQPSRAERDTLFAYPHAVENLRPPIELNFEDRNHLVQCFMREFNPYHQFLSSEEAPSIVVPSLVEGNDIDAVFRENALLSVATSFTSRPNLANQGPAYAGAAESLVLRCIKDRPSDLVVQGLALLSWRELMFGSPAMAYNYIAMATGQVLHLGLHVGSLVKSTVRSEADHTVQRRRIRSFWAYFSVDRLTTSSLGMNCTMHWQRVKAPSFLSSLSQPASVDDVAHERFCELWHLWDSCMDQVYAFGWAQLSRSEKEALVLRSHEALTGFFRDSDAVLKIGKDYMPTTAIWMQLSYYTALILIHRPLLNEPTHSSAGRFALRSATTAAASISRIARMYRKTNTFQLSGPQVMDSIMTAAVIHLLNATAGKTLLGRQSANGLRSCMEALSDMQSKWTTRTEAAIRRIRELAHRWEVVWALPIQFSQPPTAHEGVQKDLITNGGFNNTSLIQTFDSLDGTALDGTIEAMWQSTSSSDFWVYDDSTQPPYLDWLFEGDHG